VLQALPDDLRAQFAAEYQDLLNAAYPTGPYGTVLPFRRVFVVAQRGHDASNLSPDPPMGGLFDGGVSVP
jgi:hypothetical protein